MARIKGRAKPDPNDMTFLEHLEELRARIIVILACLAVASAASYLRADAILATILEPVTSLGYKVVFIGPAEALVAKIKIALFIGFLLTLPVILYQTWKFVSPALEGQNRRMMGFFLLASWFCFTGGVTLCFFLVYRPAVGFLLRLAGPDLVPMLSIGRYVSFTICFLLPSGVLCQVPLLAWCLARMGLVSSAALAGARHYAFLVSLGLAAVITPTPDALTCFLISLPIYALYEVSVFLVRLAEKKRASDPHSS